MKKEAGHFYYELKVQKRVRPYFLKGLTSVCLQKKRPEIIVVPIIFLVFHWYTFYLWF